MPYFLILPLYVGLLFLLIVVGLLCLFVVRLRTLSAYVFAAAIGSVAGFVISFVMYYALLMLMGAVALAFQGPGAIPNTPPPATGPLEMLFHLFGAGVLFVLIFIVPFLLSAIGVAVGCLVGVVVVWRFRCRRKGAPSRGREAART